MIKPNQLPKLLQLASPMLPVGGYSYSQGLEWAIESGAVIQAEDVQLWVNDVMELVLGRFELPLLKRMALACAAHDTAALQHWNALFLAARDTAESRAETQQMGYSLTRLLRDLQGESAPQVRLLADLNPVSFPAAYACAVALWNLPVKESLEAYGWSWIENQVAVAMKTLPLGQVAGQKLMLALGAALPDWVERAWGLTDDQLSNFAPLYSIAGCRHETQYSRLFRS